MSLVLDTPILIDYLREYEPVLNYLHALTSQEKARVSVISAMELIQGASDKKSFSIVKKFLSQFIVIHLSRKTSEEAFRLQQAYHFPYHLKLADAFIAATALERKSLLITRNIKDFSFIEKLKIKKPYE